MNNRQRILFGGHSLVLHSVVVPLFAFVFMILYNPFGMESFLQMDNASYSFNATILLCVVFGSVAITRVVLFLLRGKAPASGLFYALWCVIELAVASLFVSLYLTLMLGGNASFFEVAGASFGVLFGICIYPYALLFMGFMIYAERTKEEVDPSTLVKFYDEYKKLRFVIASDAIVFIKSEENYVQIHYLDHSKPKKFVLRSSMRALEGQMAHHGLVRCHRSYFINPEYIKMIRKENYGVVCAELTEESYEPIPISRKYQQEIMQLL